MNQTVDTLAQESAGAGIPAGTSDGGGRVRNRQTGFRFATVADGSPALILATKSSVVTAGRTAPERQVTPRR